MENQEWKIYLLKELHELPGFLDKVLEFCEQHDLIGLPINNYLVSSYLDSYEFTESNMPKLLQEIFPTYPEFPFKQTLVENTESDYKSVYTQV